MPDKLEEQELLGRVPSPVNGHYSDRLGRDVPQAPFTEQNFRLNDETAKASESVLPDVNVALGSDKSGFLHMFDGHKLHPATGDRVDEPTETALMKLESGFNK